MELKLSSTYFSSTHTMFWAPCRRLFGLRRNTYVPETLLGVLRQNPVYLQIAVNGDDGGVLAFYSHFLACVVCYSNL